MAKKNETAELPSETPPPVPAAGDEQKTTEEVDPPKGSRLGHSAGSRKMVVGDRCPRNAAHRPGRIYKTDKRTRYLVCDDCGENWKLAGAFADPLKQYVHDLAESLATAEPVAATDGGPDVVLMPADQAKSIAQKLRELIAA